MCTCGPKCHTVNHFCQNTCMCAPKPQRQVAFHVSSAQSAVFSNGNTISPVVGASHYPCLPHGVGASICYRGISLFSNWALPVRNVTGESQNEGEFLEPFSRMLKGHNLVNSRTLPLASVRCTSLVPRTLAPVLCAGHSMAYSRP